MELKRVHQHTSTLRLHVLRTSINEREKKRAMANFFDIRARQAAAVAQATSSKRAAPVQDNRLQPWVEK